MLLIPDTHQAKTHPRILIEGLLLPLVQCPKILGINLDHSLSFNKHSYYVAERVTSINNILRALADISWGQQKETLLIICKAVGRSIINYAVPVWIPNLHDAYRKIQYTQNEALRIATAVTRCPLSITYTQKLKVKEHSEPLSAQYLTRYLEPENVCHSITTRANPKRQMKEIIIH